MAREPTRTLVGGLPGRQELFALVAEGNLHDRLRQEHLLREDQVVAVVVGHLVLVAHRDRIERAGDLAVAAEDATRQVDLVDGRVALARGDPVVGVVLGVDDANAVGGAGGGSE